MGTVTRAVMAGCGGISKAWLNAIKAMDNVQIVGMVDLVEQCARDRAHEYGLDAVVGTSLEDVLQRTQPDAVLDCAIPEAHLDVTLTALKHGCHVLGEKPLADSMANARTMVEAAQEAGKVFAVIQNRRYDPRIRLLRHVIESGTIGQLTTANCDFYIGAHFGGFRDRMEHVLLLDMAIHTFDAARFITGADPVSVYCTEWNPAGSWYDHDASAIAIFEMSNGLVYTYRGSWCSEGLNTNWESDWRIIGDQGSILWDGADQLKTQKVAKTGSFFSELETVEAPAFDPATKVGGHAGNIREFVHCIQNGLVPETTCTDNIKSLAMVFGAIESAETGKRVDIQ
ncbi:MAG: Gfo/Idh/MocA family protein [Anaerolineae bacterium]